MEIWIWLGAGILFLIGEIFTSGFYLACFSIGAFITAGLSVFKLGLNWNLLLFSAASFSAFIFVRPVFVKYLMKNRDSVETNVDALIGEEGIVKKTLVPPQGGRVLVRGDDWWAVADCQEPVEEGASVEVLKVSGTKLIVKKKEN